MRRQRGQGLVEFALISVLLFLVFFVILDGGRAVNAYQTVAEAAREGAHAAELQDSTDAQIRGAINAHTGLLGDLGSSATITPATSRTAMQTVSVTVTHRFRMITPLLSQFGPINFSASTVVVVE
jgi:Flp pilus assembly protein TadG